MLSLSVCRWLVLTAAEVQASQDEPETFIQEQEDLWYLLRAISMSTYPHSF